MTQEGSKCGPGVCELCLRTLSELTVHHLIPKTRHKNKKNKKDFDRHEVRHRLALLCRPCHNIVHATFTEKELERSWNTIELLLQAPDIQRFTQWVQNKPDGFRVPTRSNNNKRQRNQR